MPLTQVKVVGQGSSAATSIFGATPVGSAIGLTQGVLGSFAQQIEVSPVMGTVQDQAFMDAVARQLNVLGFSIMQPGSYAPNSFAGPDEGVSPFLQVFATLLNRCDCIAGKVDGDKALAALQDDMSSFLNALTGGPGAAQKTSSSNSGGTNTSGTINSQATSATRSVGLTDILAVDGLATKLGIGPDGKQTLGQWQHILMLKALESGGTVTKTTNIFGSRIRYNGGAVGTFAMFNADGTLECSGNVFDFGGSVPAKHFERDIQHYAPIIASQLLFQRGTCSAAGSH
jgi:hypothetical protein